MEKKIIDSGSANFLDFDYNCIGKTFYGDIRIKTMGVLKNCSYHIGDDYIIKGIGKYPISDRIRKSLIYTLSRVEEEMDIIAMPDDSVILVKQWNEEDIDSVLCFQKVDTKRAVDGSFIYHIVVRSFDRGGFHCSRNMSLREFANSYNPLLKKFGLPDGRFREENCEFLKMTGKGQHDRYMELQGKYILSQATEEDCEYLTSCDHSRYLIGEVNKHAISSLTIMEVFVNRPRFMRPWYKFILTIKVDGTTFHEAIWSPNKPEIIEYVDYHYQIYGKLTKEQEQIIREFCYKTYPEAEQYENTHPQLHHK